jgi:hypothetical protein
MRDEAPHPDHTGADGDDCPAGTRNRFFRGKTMKAEDFDKDQRYFIGRRRLITRSALGWGVVAGLSVDGPRAESHGRHDPNRHDHDREQEEEAQPLPTCPEPGAIGVGPGLALDSHGREIDVTGKRSLDAANTFLVEEDTNGCRTRPLDKVPPGRYLLSIHYAERRYGDANLPDGCGCDEPEKKYVCETAVFSLRPVATRCKCGQEPCRRTCGCGPWSSCGHVGRGPHACLCQWVSGAGVVAGTAPLCEWRGYRIDPADGVPLACLRVEVRQGKCGLEIVGCVEDDCGPRRLVKSNDLLYDLIRGCDLARISWISWAHWHRRPDPERMPWSEFESKFKPDGRTDFVVRFSQPVLIETLRRDTIVITVITREPGTGWRLPRRVPIVGIDTTPHHDPPPGYPQLPDGTTNQMRVLVRPRWVKDEVQKGGESWLGERRFRIEIEVYGDFILDCHGQAVDANPVGLRAAPTGNGTPGGTYRSNFRVEPQPGSGRDRDDE